MIETRAFLIIVGAIAFSLISSPVKAEKMTGRLIMEEVLKRHELIPYVFEEQTIILVDRAGNRDVRKVRRFSRVENDGAVKFLLIFDTPAEIRGVALSAVYQPSGRRESGIYLPALGKILKSSSEGNRGSYFLGTDFTVEDMATEFTSNFRYVRSKDQKIDKVPYFVVEAFPEGADFERTTAYSFRRHFIRQDNYFIIRTDYFDQRRRFIKRQTQHDLRNVNGKTWRADMMLMENNREQHKTLIKVNRRVFSKDYVPAKMFTQEWLLENRHLQTIDNLIIENASGRKPEE